MRNCAPRLRPCSAIFKRNSAIPSVGPPLKAGQLFDWQGCYNGMKQLILLRHGQSAWNLENRFTGWTDVELTDEGRAEARRAGERLLAEGIVPDVAFTSYLRRAIHTLWIALDAMDRQWIPVIKDWHLNERHYGALQGLNKADTAAEYGDEQVKLWRRSFDVRPPQITPDDSRFGANDPRYASENPAKLPLGESLADTIRRVDPCWEELIEPALKLNSTVLVTAHGNSLRALAKMLLGISDADIVNLEIPTGTPWVFTLTDRFEVTSNRLLK